MFTWEILTHVYHHSTFLSGIPVTAGQMGSTCSARVEVCPSSRAAPRSGGLQSRDKDPKGGASVEPPFCAKNAQEGAPPAVNSSALPLRSPRSGRMALEHGLCRTMGAGSRSTRSAGYSEAFDLSFVGDVQFAAACIDAVHTTLLD